MTFTLRKEHLAIHDKIAHSKLLIDIAQQLEHAFPAQFTTQINNDPLGWSEKAIAKAKEYEFDGDDEILYEFCRILLFVGLNFDKNKEYVEIVGVFHGNLNYVPYPLTKLEQIEWIDYQLESQTNSINDGKNR